jgi:hypothetical protein
MKCIGFVGDIEKTELVMYVAKVLASLNKKVIYIDATTKQKTRYIIPTIAGMEEQNQYVVQHDSVEFAIGYTNMLELKKYFLSKGEDFTEFEYVLVNTDMPEMCEEYDLKNANNLFFVSSFDKYHIIKGIELLKYMCAMKRKTDPEAQVALTKLLYYSEINTADSRYIDGLAENLPLLWVHDTISYPYDQGDISASIQNQYGNKIDFRYLTAMYKNAVMDTVSVITGDEKSVLKKVLKNIEREARFSR